MRNGGRLLKMAKAKDVASSYEALAVYAEGVR